MRAVAIGVLLALAGAGCAGNPQRPADSSLECARAVVAALPPGLSDPEKHCLASAGIARRCSPFEAWLAGWGKELRDAFTVVAFTPDGKQVITGGNDKFLRYWNLADGKEAKKIGTTPDYIFGVAISKDGKRVATAGYGGSLRVYDLASGDRIYPPKQSDPKKDEETLKAADAARRGAITYCIAFTPDGNAIVTGQHELKSGKGHAKVTPLSK